MASHLPFDRVDYFVVEVLVELVLDLLVLVEYLLRAAI